MIPAFSNPLTIFSKHHHLDPLIVLYFHSKILLEETLILFHLNQRSFPSFSATIKYLKKTIIDL